MGCWAKARLTRVPRDSVPCGHTARAVEVRSCKSMGEFSVQLRGVFFFLFPPAITISWGTVREKYMSGLIIHGPPFPGEWTELSL